MNKLKFWYIFLLFIWWVDSQCCITLQGKKCIRCTNGTHLFRDNCIIDVDNCATYKDGFDCLTCNNGFQLNTNGECIPTPIPTTDNSKDYVDTILDLQNLSATNRNIYTLSNDYFNAFKTQLKSAQPLGAILRLYKNNSLQITIQYKGLNNIYYQGVLQPDLLNLIFKEISFGVIPAPTLPVQTTINQTTPSNTTNNIVISTISPILPASNNTTSNNANITLAYKNFDVNSNNQSYLISLDFLISQLPKYSTLKPTVALIATTNFLIYYKLTFSLADKSSWQVTLTFSPQNFLLNLLSDLQIQPSQKAPLRTYQKVDTNTIYQDFIFIIAYQYINKQSNNKYKDSVINSVEKADDVQNIQYKVIFQQGGFYWQVLAQINKNNFVTNGYQQNKKSHIPNVNPNPVSVNGGTLNTITEETQVSIKSNTANNQSLTPSTSNQTVSTNPNNNSNVNPPVNPNPISTPNTTITPNTNISTNTTPTSYQNTNSNPSLNQNSNNTASTNNLISNTTKTTNNTTTLNPNLNTNPNTNNNTNPNTNNNIVLPKKITENIAGLTQLSPTQLAGAEFAQIQALVKNSNTNQLSGATLVGAYISSVSFTRNYRIYYIKNQQFFQSRVTRDNLRKRTYIISFTKII